MVLHEGAAGSLQPEKETIDFAALHICWLRITNPELANVGQHQAWEDNTLLAGLVPNAPTDGYEALKTQYDAIADEQPFMFSPDIHMLTFSQAYNIPALAQVFAALDEVDYAEPNGLIGGEQDGYEYQDMGGGVWRWIVRDEFWDCFDGCDCARVWSYDIDHAAGDVTEISYAEMGQPWCEF